MDDEIETFLECAECGKDIHECTCPKNGWQYALDFLANCIGGHLEFKEK